MKLPPDWSEFLSLLSRHRVKFLLIGGHALAVHGHPRATLDLDVFVERASANARRIGAALADFGFAEAAAQWEHLIVPDRMLTLDGRRVNVIGLRELRRNKRASGRAKDLLDIALLAEGRVRRTSRRS